MTEESDQNIVIAALADPNAYGRLIRKHESMLRRYVRRILGTRSNATDDVLQEVFIKAYLNLNDFDQTRTFAPWIYRIAHNEAISHLRKSKSGIQTITGEDAQVFLDYVADPEDPATLFWKGRSADHIRTCLNALDAKYRDVLVLRYMEDQSYDDISDILRLPPGTVATLLKRGLKRLKDIFDLTGGQL
jgi:RNA polymerase sigma-70 factor, ECF subfamily